MDDARLMAALQVERGAEALASRPSDEYAPWLVSLLHQVKAARSKRWDGERNG